MITPDAIATAYSFLHQKRNVYVHSTLDWQRDDIEMAVSAYSEQMDGGLYAVLAEGRDDFLRNHQHFSADISEAVNRLEKLLSP